MEAILTQLAHDRPRAGFMLGGLSAALDEAMRSSALKLAVACSDVQQKHATSKMQHCMLEIARSTFWILQHAPCTMHHAKCNVAAACARRRHAAHIECCPLRADGIG